MTRLHTVLIAMKLLWLAPLSTNAQGGGMINLNEKTASSHKDSVTSVHSSVVSFQEAVLDSLYQALVEAREVEDHLHNKARWFGRHATQAANNWALQDTLGLFVATSGNNTWGVDAADTTKIFGSSDTPTVAGKKYFDMHKIFVTAASQTSVYKIRFVWSTTNFAAGLAAGNYTETVVIVASAASRISPSEIVMPRLASGTKVWAQAWNATDNATVSFLVAIHEYIQ